MGKEVLVILMIAFGLFAIIMFILFFVYLKKYYNNKHLEDDYKKEIEEESKEIIEDNSINEEYDMEYIPIKKK